MIHRFTALLSLVALLVMPVAPPPQLPLLAGMLQHAPSQPGPHPHVVEWVLPRERLMEHRNRSRSGKSPDEYAADPADRPFF